MGVNVRMAGCFSFRKRWHAVNKPGQKTYTSEGASPHCSPRPSARRTGLCGEHELVFSFASFAFFVVNLLLFSEFRSLRVSAQPNQSGYVKKETGTCLA